MLRIHSNTNLNYKFKWPVVNSYRNNTSNSSIVIKVIKQELTTTEVIKHMLIAEVIKHMRKSPMVASVQ
jgi:hypothetical protein